MDGITAGTITAIIGVLIWYLKYQTKRQAIREDKHDAIQKEERVFYRNLVTNDMKELHQDNIKSVEVTNKSIVFLKDISNSQKRLCTLIGNVDRKINGK